jgi:hypothetical protein
MAERQLPKLHTRVRFPSPAPSSIPNRYGHSGFPRFVAVPNRPDQYRATMMIATTMNAASSERARSRIFDPGFAVKSAGGMGYLGGCNSPTSQPTSPDFIGSDAIAIFST